MIVRIGGRGHRRGKPWNTWLIFGIFLVIGALWGFRSGTEAYQERLTQVDWPTTQATVVQVEVFRERSGPVKHPIYHNYYNVTYEYVVNGTVYTEFVEHQSAQASVGDTFPVKYNPQAPEQSTDILKPTKDYIWVNAILCVAGITLVVLSIWRKVAWSQES